MDQKVVTTTPTTSAWAASISIVLAAISNMRMDWSPIPEQHPVSAISWLLLVRAIY